MRMTIVVPDNLVLIDDVAHEVDCSSLRGMHAVSWVDNQGVVEYDHDHDPTKCKGPSHITNVTVFQREIDAWNAANKAAKAAARR